MKQFLLLSFLFISITSYSQVRVSGTVTDIFNNVPLYKAMVSLNGAQGMVITNEKGFFTIVLKKGGVYDFEVSKNGYKSLYQQIELHENIDIEITLMSNAGTKEAKLVENKNLKAEKDKNYLKDDEFDFEKKARIKQLEEERLAEKIRYETELAEQNRIANEKAKKQAEKPKVRRINSASSMSKLINKSLLTLSGAVKDKKTGNPIPNAIISFEGKGKTYSTRTDGLFKIKIKKGEYTMTVKNKGYKTETAKFPVGSNLDITILLTKKGNFFKRE